jgi:hypothetical protein
MACIAEKPAVQKLEADLGDRANVLRVSINTAFGRQLMERFDVSSTPTFVLFDRQGSEIWRGTHAPNTEQVLSTAQ